MTLTKYNNVFDELGFPRGFVDDFFRSTPVRAAQNAGQTLWTPAVDIVENEHDLTLRADLPGLKTEDIEVKVENGTLILKGKREFRQEEKEKGYHRIERSYGAFTRAFGLPDTVDTEKVQAEYKNGVLEVVLAKRDAAKPKTVAVKVAG